ncbi:MAG TPA: beta-ketoacyl reductase, partial [Casimicrobiaceae bacterium]
GMLESQTWDRFARVMNPKVAGAWNLHEATSRIDLDHFVLFSSIASLLGSNGQGNHASANAFLDALAAYRRARGMAGLSINWGAWSDVGAAADRQIGGRIASRGWSEIPPDQGLAALEYLLSWPRPQVSVTPIDWPTYARQFAEGDAPSFVSDMIEANRARVKQAPREVPPGARDEAAASNGTAPTIAERVMAASLGERSVLVERFVREHVGKVLGIPSIREADVELPLMSMGLDSLLAVELRNSLNRSAGLSRRLPATLLFDYPSVAALSKHLLSLMGEDAAVASPLAPAPSIADFAATPIASSAVDELEISEMTDEEAERLLLEELN